MIKRTHAVILSTMSIALLLLLCACGKTATMFIVADDPANGNLAQPFQQYAYQFTTDDSVNYMAVRAYELDNGEWKQLCELGRTSVEPGVNRVSMAFDRIPEGFSVSGDTYTMGASKDMANLGCATTMLDSKTEIVPGEELPLAIQSLTSEDTVRSCLLEDFYDVEKLRSLNYDHIYAVTIYFDKI